MAKPLKCFLLFLFFFIATLLLYSQTIHSKFVFDFVDLVFDFQKRAWGDLGNFSTGLLPNWIAKLFFFVLLKLFGFNAHLWYALSCALHALNALLLLLLVEKALVHFNYNESFKISVFAATLFLVSPYHTETIVWGGALNYLLVSFFILLQLVAVAKFHKSRNLFWMLVASCIFLLAVFTHEWGLFLLPADFLLLFLFSENFDALKRKENFLLMGSVLAVIAIYFSNQLLRGTLIGHYGAETHLNFKLYEIVPAFEKYVLKILFLFTLAPVAIQDKVYALLQSTILLYTTSFFLVLALLSLLVFVWKKKENFAPTVFFFFLFCLFVFPVLNLYFPYWIPIHADRYCYLPAAFLYSSCCIALFKLKTIFRFLLPALFAAVSVWFLLQINQSWHQAGLLEQKLESSFKWWNSKRVFILNLPDNFRGAYMYRNLRPSAYEGNFIKYNYRIPKTEIVEVLNYNLNEPQDSVTIQKISDKKLKVELSNSSSWWWLHTLGATDYETDFLKVDVDDFNHSYLVQFKQKQEGDVFLYQANGNWRQVENF